MSNTLFKKNFIYLLTTLVIFFSFSFAARVVTGNVRNTSGTNLQNIRIYFVSSNPITWFGPTNTDSGGNYIYNPGPAIYFLKAEDPAGIYFPQWYKNAFGDSDRITVDATNLFKTITGNDFVLYNMATVNGHVANGAGALIEVFLKSPTYTWVNSVFANGSGDYSVTVPATVALMVRASRSGYMTQLFNSTGADAFTDSDATTVTVTTISNNVDINLNPAINLSGSISGAGSTIVTVSAYQNNNGVFKYINQTASNTGAYSLAVPANYNLKLQATAIGFMNVFNKDAETVFGWDDATTQNYPVSQTGKNFTMYQNITLNGTISGLSGEPVTVTAFEKVNGVLRYINQVSRVGNGAYALAVPKSYNNKIQAQAAGYMIVLNNNGEVVFGWDDAATQNYLSDQFNKNFFMYPIITLSGTISGLSGDPVTVTSLEFVTGNFRYVSQTSRVGNGAYTIQIPKNYNNKIQAEAVGYTKAYNNNLLTVFSWDAAATQNYATSQGSKNFAMIQQATINGTVRDSNNNLMDGVTINVFQKNTVPLLYLASATTAPGTGVYNVNVPANLDLIVKASTSNPYYREYFYNQSRYDTGAVTFNLVSGATSSNINFTLDKIWKITGNISLDAGGNVSGSLVEVFGYNDWNTFFDQAIVTASGYYEITGTGNPNIMVRFSTGNYVTKIWPTLNYMSDITLNNRISVVSGNSYSLGTVTLNLGGIVAGRITADGGTGPVVTVNVEDLTGKYFTNITINATGGNYSINRVPTGNWLVKALKLGLISEYYGETASTQNATTVNISAGLTSTNVNIEIAPSWSMTGTVNVAGVGPIAGATVTVFKYAPGFQYIDSATTNALGQYNIAEGYNTVNVYVQASYPGFVTMFYNNSRDGYPTANSLAMAPLNTTSNINFTIFQPAFITGNVKDTNGQNIPGAKVAAFQRAGYFVWVNDTLTDVNGNYTLSVDPLVNVFLQATANNYITVFYNQATVSDNAVTFNLASGQVSKNINFFLEKTWTITGNVTLNTGLSPSGSLVEVFGYNDWTKFLGQATVAGSGYYSLSGTGDRQVMVRYSTGNYVTMLWPTLNYMSDITLNNRISIVSGNIYSLGTVTLNLGGWIGGTIIVTGGTGPVVTVNVEDPNGKYFSSVTIAATGGGYSVPKVPAGQWKVKALKLGLVGEYFGETASTVNAVTVNVTAGATTNFINISIAPEWTVSGKITSRSGAPIGGAVVTAFQNAPGFIWISDTTSNALDGTYTIHNGYNSTSINIKASAAGYQDMFYNGKLQGFPTADVITIGPGDAQAGINITMNGLAFVTGHVYDAGFVPVVGATVNAFLKDGSFTFLSQTTADATGFYSIGIPDFTPVMLQASSRNYQTKFYNQADDWPTATTFNLATGVTSPNIDFHLPKAWILTGNVALADKADFSGSKVDVFAYNNWQIHLGQGTTDASGNYQVSGTGNVDVMIKFSNSTYVPKLYSKTDPNHLIFFSNITSDNKLTVTAGITLQGLNPVTLNPGGGVAGAITTVGGLGSVVTINIEDLNGNFFVNTTINAAGSAYSFNQVPSGSWLVKAMRQGLVSEYYGETASTVDAFVVTVNGGVTTNGINISIGQPWTVSGHVTLLSGGTNAGNVRIEVFRYIDGFHFIDSTTTNANGNYLIANGYNDTNIFVRAVSTNYVTLYYNNKILDWHNADSIHMVPGTSTDNINFQIYKVGLITGTVTNNLNGLPVASVTVDAFRASDNIWVAETMTSPDGTYSLGVIPDNPVNLKISRRAFVSQLYKGINENDFSHAATISVTGGGTSPNINFTMVPLWRIGGTISSSAAGKSTAGCLVLLYEFNNTANLITSANANSSGFYELSSTGNITPNVMLWFSLAQFKEQIYLGNENTQNILPANSIPVSLGITDSVTFNVTLTFIGPPIEPIPPGKTIKDTIMAGPNPSNPDKELIHIGFIIDTDSQVNIRVYTLGGELVYENSRACIPGYNEFTWNGEDLYSDKIPNGVYLAYVQIDTGSEKIKKVLKIAILR